VSDVARKCQRGCVERSIGDDDKAELAPAVDGWRYHEMAPVVPIARLRHYPRCWPESDPERRHYLHPNLDGLRLRGAVRTPKEQTQC